MCQAPLQKSLQLCKILLPLSCLVLLLAPPTYASVIYRSLENSLYATVHSQPGQFNLFLPRLSDYDLGEQYLNPLIQLEVPVVGNIQAFASPIPALYFRAFFLFFLQGQSYVEAPLREQKFKQFSVLLAHNPDSAGNRFTAESPCIPFFKLH